MRTKTPDPLTLVRAIESAGGDYDALVDGVVYQVNQSFIVGRMCFKVEGTPINTKAAVSLNGEQKKKLMLHSQRAAQPN